MLTLIEVGKKYKLRDGREVFVTKVDLNNTNVRDGATGAVYFKFSPKVAADYGDGTWVWMNGTYIGQSSSKQHSDDIVEELFHFESTQLDLFGE